MPPIHPFFDALLEEWCRQRGGTSAWIRGMMRGEIPASRAFVAAIQAEYGVPLGAWPLLEPEYPLTSDIKSTTLQSMTAINSAELAQGLSRSRSRKHPFVRALYENPDPKKRMTIAEWAARHGLKKVTVASWYATGNGARRIPQSIAQTIEKELGVPATLAVWKNGITTER